MRKLNEDLIYDFKIFCKNNRISMSRGRGRHTDLEHLTRREIECLIDILHDALERKRYE